MKNSKLRTDFICIATSGHTVDGRQITPKELHEMADTYDREYYAALLWHEHDRSWMSMGEVLEVKAEDEGNETKLYAVIAPNSQLVNMNNYGMGLFSSIEIMPNFRNTGKAYLFGLGITDTPASVGTTKLELFSNNLPKTAQAGEFIKFDFALSDTEDAEEKAKNTLFNALKQFFSFSGNEPENKSESDNKNNKEDYEMDQKQIDQLATAIVTGLGAKLDGYFSVQPKPTEADPKAPEQPKEPEQPKGGETVSKEEFSQLQEKFDALAAKFNALNQEVTPVPNGVPAEAEKFNVAV
ncbi:GPO family capsid scaffolding protein [Aggregatibacter actinomycetemcomitans]|uniref:GPO family capsid scaffolding protein n=1 Tax=Aggregatibacter actinomycetemcomitans TaxID=714 RepID=UPI00197C5D53|nr:GPO family capsid scaffolding protein [Aggregatibacter actinomycetemcomitans]MBN6067866.1 GPO family capsid scaffolding protein [Aggregatibacter actinomycetemcomitans]MBN6085803.1 GPO family capsid scaffolding protein [Aggregatibacter actinomycetemcomitans]